MYEKIIEAVNKKLDDLGVLTRNRNYLMGASDMGDFVIELIEEMAYESPEE